MNKTRQYYLKRKYGITEEQYDYLLRKQEFRCGVCGRPSVGFKSRLCVDHDHSTGEVRGLLCNYCNRRIVGRHRSQGRGYDVNSHHRGDISTSRFEPDLLNESPIVRRCLIGKHYVICRYSGKVVCCCQYRAGG